MKIKNSEDLDIWKLSKELTVDIYGLCEKQGRLKNDKNIINQITRSALSVMSNIAEGFERFSNKEFINFLVIARGSLAETKSITYLISEIYNVDIRLISVRINSLHKKINSLITHLRKNK